MLGELEAYKYEEGIIIIMNEVFEYQTTVTIGDTNALQNMYFLNYFKLQGIVRELWVKEEVGGGFEDLTNGMILITKNAQCEFRKNLYLFDDVTVRMNISHVGRTNMTLNFSFYKTSTDELHAEGSQTIVFANSMHRIIAIPENWRQAIKRFSYKPGKLELSDA